MSVLQRWWVWDSPATFSQETRWRVIKGLNINLYPPQVRAWVAHRQAHVLTTHIHRVVVCNVHDCIHSLSSPVIKHWLKVSWGGNRLFHLQSTIHHGWKSEQELKTGTCRQMFRQRPWRSAYWLALPGLPSLLSYTIQDYLAMVCTALSGLGFSHKPLIDNLPIGNPGEAFRQLRCSLPGWP